MVMHSGNYEVIGVRHRKTQTLYISHLIETHRCSNPAYGKIQVGIYIAAIQETIDRTRQEIEKRDENPSAGVPSRTEEAILDGGLDDSPEQPTRPKSSNNPRGKGKQREGNAKRHASGNVVDNQVCIYLLCRVEFYVITAQALLASATGQNHLCLRFFYEIYDSPHPASFCRVNELGEPAGPTGPQPTPLFSGYEVPPLSSGIHITVHSELPPGSTGIVHIGTMAVDQSGHTVKVAVKLAFSKDEKIRLKKEHQVYSLLQSRDVQGVPHNIGLFIDEEQLLDAEGPYALVTSYAGVSIFDHSTKHTLDSVRVKQVTKSIFVSVILIIFAETHCSKL